MKVKELRGTKLAKLICKILGAQGAVLYPLVIFKYEVPPKDLIKHEYTHVDQIKRHGVIRFYLSYLLEYFSYRVRGDSDNVAYHRISYEKEAYARERE